MTDLQQKGGKCTTTDESALCNVALLLFIAAAFFSRSPESHHVGSIVAVPREIFTVGIGHFDDEVILPNLL